MTRVGGELGLDRAKPARILIVDDEEINIDVLVGLLGREYRLNIAANGEQVFQRMAAAPLPDLILLDIVMDGMDGYEVCRRLKADPATQDIPVIFLTARKATEDAVAGFRLGAVDFITKPFQPEELAARVGTHIRLRRVVVELEQALEEIKTLRGILPICSFCKRIRDDQGYWKQLEEYIHQHSEAEFSHSICRECARKYYPDLDLGRAGRDESGSSNT